MSDKLNDVLGQLNKKYGKGTVQKMNKEDMVSLPTTSSGSLTLDMALGGGFADGRIIEIFGPESSGKTSISLSALAEEQEKGGNVAIIDMEHALDPMYAETIGLNMSEVTFTQPDFGEQALDIAEALIGSGEFSAILIDSVAALVPKAELDGEMGDSKMGLHARLMSQALRKLTPLSHKHNCKIFFINQIREKIGVMFGCFSYNTRVSLSDGTSEKIGKIVNQKMDVEVLSFDPKTNKVSPRKILNYFNNGKADGFLSFTVKKIGSNGVSRFKVTPNHTIFTPYGEIDAGSLKVGDDVMGISEERISNSQFEIIYGSILGDGSLRLGRSGDTSSIRFGHGSEQDDYCKWKYSLLENISSNLHINSAGGLSFETHQSPELLSLRKDSYSESFRTVSKDLLKNFSLLSMAIWYMDDGTFSGSFDRWGFGKCEISIKSYGRQDSELLVDMCDKLGVGRPTLTGKNSLLWSGDRVEKLHSKICKFIPKSMQYKLSPRFRDKFVGLDIEKKIPVKTMIPVKVLKIEDSIEQKKGFGFKYDLEIEGNHTYIVDGVGVHNSPETTTGGNALKFYATQRLDVRKQVGQASKETDGTLVNIPINFKVIKNKIAPPFTKGTLTIKFGEGIDKISEIMDIGVELGILEKSGAWFAYKGTKIGQGKDKSREMLKDNPELLEEIEGKVLKEING